MSPPEPSLQAAQPAPSPHNSSILPPDESSDKGLMEQEGGNIDGTPKLGGKRRLFGLGRKKEGEKDKKGESQPLAQTGASAPDPVSMPPPSIRKSPPPELKHTPGSPPSSMRMLSSASSPTRHFRSSSPRHHSPAASEIFERNVQESAVPEELSPAIPSHVQIEDHIPPVLEASSLAITDDHLGPDEVEIVMHAAHQPASAAVAGGSIHESGILAPPEELPPHHEGDDSASNYGALDNADVRRLSFISFADVVHAEHAEQDSVHLMSLSSTTNRSPSPVRSPASSHGIGPSPPTSGAPSMKGMDLTASKGARIPGSPGITHTSSSGGELMVETMRQALRKTESGDLSGARSQPMSPTLADDVSAERTFR